MSTGLQEIKAMQDNESVVFRIVPSNFPNGNVFPLTRIALAMHLSALATVFDLKPFYPLSGIFLLA